MVKKLLIAILIVGAALRFLGAGVIPVGFTPDEASFGYDAYSIIKTGKDQWGANLPLVLKSFGDYKAPLYTFLLVPLVYIFGLAKYVTRLPNLIFGTSAILATFLLARTLADLSGFKDKRRDFFALSASFLLAISPWHVMMSRGAFEANLTTFLLPLGIYLFVKGTKKPVFLIYSSIIFGLNLFSYHAAKLVVPVVVVFMLMIFLKKLGSVNRGILLLSGTIFAVFLVATFYTFSLGAGTRATGVSIFNGASNDSAQPRLTAIQAGLPETLAVILHNKYQVIARKFISNYFQYFSPQFYFTGGPSETTYGMIPGRGVLYWFELPFLLGLLYYFWKYRLTKYLAIPIVWLMIAPIPAALTLGSGYAGNRAVVMLPAMQILLSLGALTCYETLQSLLTKSRLRQFTYVFFGFMLLFFITFCEDYFIQSPRINEKGMSYGNLEVANWLNGNVPKTQKVIVSTTLSEPHMYIAFASRIDPIVYQAASSNWPVNVDGGVSWVDQLPDYRLANYEFKRLSLSDLSQKNTTIVGRPDEFPTDIKPITIFKYPSGETAVFVVASMDYNYAFKDR